MASPLIQLVILFFVIFDPLASLIVFFTATKGMKNRERMGIAIAAVSVAAIISLVFLLFGQPLLDAFNTSIDNFRIAGGVILGILGVKMALGHSIANATESRDSARAIAAVIGTPLLTGPAAISAIIISSSDYGMLVTGIAVAIVLAFTIAIFLASSKLNKLMGKTSVQVMSTILGLITLAWGIGFIRAGLGL